MNCLIYKGRKKPDMYLYVRKEEDLSRVPKSLLDSLGTLELVMELDISPERKMAKENPRVVLQNLEQCGYHVQLPSRLSDYIHA